MYDYLKGKITYIYSNSVVLDNQDIGYKIFVANPYSFNLNEELTIYIYNHIREDELSLYGFKTITDRELFLKLINVKGLGPKMALPIIAAGSVAGIMDAIEKENILYLTKFPKIGEKLARQIILDLKGKLVSNNKDLDTSSFEELVSVLENLGYKKINIKQILPKVDKTITLEEQIKEALRLLLK